VINYVSEINSSNDIISDQIMCNIASYKTKIFIAYDGGYPFGIVACTNRTFYYHQILQFIYLERKYQTIEIYNNIFDLLIQTIRYSGLAIITQNPISEEYFKSGFFQIDFKNSEKALVYLRTTNRNDEYNKEEYIRKHVKYLKNYKRLYSSFVYSIFLFSLSIINILLFVFNDSVSLYIKVPLLLVAISLFAYIFLSPHLLKKYNAKGEKTFGFTYDMPYINLIQYKFTSKTKEFFSNFVQALKDSGV
jgi:hypothetical protein